MSIFSFKKEKPDLSKLDNFLKIKESLSEKLQISLSKDSDAELMSLEGALKNTYNPNSSPRNCALYLKTFNQTIKKHKSSFSSQDKQTLAILCIAIISRVSRFLDDNKDSDLSSGNANSGLFGVALMLSFNNNKKLPNYPSTFVKELSTRTGKSNIKQAWNNLIVKYNKRVDNFEKEFPDYNKNHPQQLITHGKTV